MKQTSHKGSIYDASTYTLQTLLKIRNNDNTRFVDFDFTYCSQKALDRLFPVTIEAKYSLTPPSFRSSAASIRSFQLRLALKDKSDHISFEKAEFDRIEESSLSSHIGDVDTDLCNDMSLHYLRYFSQRKAPFKNSEMGFKHLIRESIVEFGVRVTKDTKKWPYDADYIGALKSKTSIDSFDDEWFCKRIQSEHPVDVFDTFGFISSTYTKDKRSDCALRSQFFSSNVAYLN